jgi:hypothetical protein
MPGRTLPPRSRTQGSGKWRARAYRFSGNTPAFPARWFDGLCRARPGDEFCSCHRRRRIKADRAGWPDFASAGLTSATDARPTRFCRTQRLSFVKRLHQALAGRPHVASTHGQARPATTTRARRCRVHRNLPLVVTTADAPLSGTGWRSFKRDLGSPRSGMFFLAGLDGWNRVDWIEEIRLWEQGRKSVCFYPR